MVFLTVLALILTTVALLLGGVFILLPIADFLICSFGALGTLIFFGICGILGLLVIINARWWNAKYEAAVQKKKNKNKEI